MIKPRVILTLCVTIWMSACSSDAENYDVIEFAVPVEGEKKERLLVCESDGRYAHDLVRTEYLIAPEEIQAFSTIVHAGIVPWDFTLRDVVFGTENPPYEYGDYVRGDNHAFHSSLKKHLDLYLETTSDFIFFYDPSIKEDQLIADAKRILLDDAAWKHSSYSIAHYESSDVVISNFFKLPDNEQKFLLSTAAVVVDTLGVGFSKRTESLFFMNTCSKDGGDPLWSQVTSQAGVTDAKNAIAGDIYRDQVDLYRLYDENDNLVQYIIRKISLSLPTYPKRIILKSEPQF